MKQETLVIIIMVAIVSLVFGFAFSSMKVMKQKDGSMIKSFEECVAAGYPIMESYPQQCRTDSGQTFVQTIPSQKDTFDAPAAFTINQTKTFDDGLKVTLQSIGDSRCKPEMVCVWAGELSPVFMVTGGDIGAPQIEVKLGSLTQKQVTTYNYAFALREVTETKATIIITKESDTAGRCYVAGCSNEVCSSQKGVASACIYKEEFACYKTATCERQGNGQCGWTQTEVLKTCLNQYK